MQATARLALSTATQVRYMSGLITKTASIPDASLLGKLFADYAKIDRPWTDNLLAFTWAEIILLALDHPQGLHEESLMILQAHAIAFTSAASLKTTFCSVKLFGRGTEK